MTDETPTLEQRVAALEEALAHPPRFVLPSWDPLTPEEEAGLRESIEAAMKAGPFRHEVILQPPPLTRDEVRQLLRECVTVVGPGESVVVRVPWGTEPRIIRDLYEAVWSLDLGFGVLIIPGDELGVAQPEPDAVEAT